MVDYDYPLEGEGPTRGGQERREGVDGMTERERARERKERRRD